jgi:hypothetical protein
MLYLGIGSVAPFMVPGYFREEAGQYSDDGEKWRRLELLTDEQIGGFQVNLPHWLLLCASDATQH